MENNIKLSYSLEFGFKECIDNLMDCNPFKIHFYKALAFHKQLVNDLPHEHQLKTEIITVPDNDFTFTRIYCDCGFSYIVGNYN